MRPLAVFLVVLGLGGPAAAAEPEPPAQRTAPAPAPRRPAPKRTARDEVPKMSLRPFFVVTGQQFAASKTFEATMGSAFQPFYGGGLEFSMRNGLFIDVTASRFSKDGERAFFNDNQSFGLGIPLTASVTPIEVSAGYRFLRVSRLIVPYAGAGFGSYGYQESSQFSDAAVDVDTRHSGLLLVGGAEFRVSKWVALSGDAQYTHVTGILGAGGVSQAANESDLGGIAMRFRVLIGR